MNLLDKMNLPFNEIVLKTTIDGNDYLFEKNNKLITGTRSSLKGENVLNVFKPEDRALLKKLFQRIQKYLGYEDTNYDYNIREDVPRFEDAIAKNKEGWENGFSRLLTVTPNELQDILDL